MIEDETPPNWWDPVIFCLRARSLVYGQIMVAAICRDEAANIDDWYKNVQYADRIVLIDTGSADDTADVAQYYAGIHEDFQIIRLYPSTQRAC